MTIRDFTLSIAGRRRPVDHRRASARFRTPQHAERPDAAAQGSRDRGAQPSPSATTTSRSPGACSTCWRKQQGLTREDYAKQIAGALPFLLAALNNQAFQNKVAGALGAFLQDPKSLTIKLAPASPVTGGEIMALAGTAPQTLPDRLNASVTANTPSREGQTMIGRATAFGVLLLAAAAPAHADEESEAMLRDFVDVGRCVGGLVGVGAGGIRSDGERHDRRGAGLLARRPESLVQHRGAARRGSCRAAPTAASPPTAIELNGGSLSIRDCLRLQRAASVGEGGSRCRASRDWSSTRII